MRLAAFMLLVLLCAAAGSVSSRAQAWLTVAVADGGFRLDMPVPFVLSSSPIGRFIGPFLYGS
jgi:hypothetical protein